MKAGPGHVHQLALVLGSGGVKSIAGLGVAELLRRAGFSSQRFALRQDHLICDRLGQAFGNLRIEELPIPLRINATDALTGERVVLSQGPLISLGRRCAEDAWPQIEAAQRPPHLAAAA